MDDKKLIEKHSCAITLSDMEIFIFPEILYALVLANSMSSVIWEWKKDVWFADLASMNEHRKIMRVKQFIMDKFIFNLDLDTWGLTTKQTELSRFSEFIDRDVLAKSNALFGYEGDKYYFDIDIRKHFGLEKYDNDVIPYWKTETVEAMEAFKFRKNFLTGAGECVSLSTMYAAALFVIADISLEKIHLLATPLHSQNFIDLHDGIITNNRRTITKTMWFNGTEQSIKARRAIENEKITILVNNYGYVHTMYDTATMPKEKFEETANALRKYLTVQINFEIFVSFLRENIDYQRHFQFCIKHKDKILFIESETVFSQESLSKSRAGTTSHKSLLGEIDDDKFVETKIENRLVLEDFEVLLKKNKLDPKSAQTKRFFIENLQNFVGNPQVFAEKIVNFSHVEPKLPNISKKKFVQTEPIILSAASGRQNLISQIYEAAKTSTVANLAITAFRDIKNSGWKPFLKAAFERNPVCFDGLKSHNFDEIYEILKKFENVSIYKEDFRLAQPDEVWNFTRGDGLEKAILLACVIFRKTRVVAKIKNYDKTVEVAFEQKIFSFETNKKVLPIEDFCIGGFL
ncbi:MAG: hypothetical protein LBH98_04755 [Chitinispirillales bacterium]|nr:hypothetical protein [Chitinispirillales bacterium]